MTKRLGVALAAIGGLVTILGALAEILSYVETSESLPRWAHRLSDMPSGVAAAIMALGILLVLFVAIAKLVRLERSWDAENADRDADYRLWISNRERDLANRVETAIQEINRFHESYSGRLTDLERAIAEGAQWVHVTIGRPVRLTSDANAVYKRCDENQKRRIREGIVASRKDTFYKTEIEEMAR